MRGLSNILTATLKSFTDLMFFTFSKDTNIYDEKIVEKIFSNKDNKDKLINALNSNKNDSIEVELNSDNELEIVK